MLAAIYTFTFQLSLFHIKNYFFHWRTAHNVDESVENGAHIHCAFAVFFLRSLTLFRSFTKQCVLIVF